MWRKGELSPAAIDRSWPHQIALPARLCEKGDYKEIHDFCKDLTLCTCGHAVYDNSAWFHVYCFAKPEDADKFNQHFGSVKFDPAQSGKGRNWARWNRP